MGYAWWVMGNFLKVCLPSGVLEALIMADWRRGCEREEDGERRGSGRRATLNQECVFASVATATDMISTHKGKRTPAKTDSGARQTALVSIAVEQCILGEEEGHTQFQDCSVSQLLFERR